MDEEALKKLVKAGEIAKTVREEAVKKAKPGMKLLELADYIEKRIRELGGEPAFPVNLSLNDIAAHYTPLIMDDKTIPDGSILKIDIGVHVDGYIADTAATVSFNSVYDGLLEASRKALEKAIEVFKPAVRVNDVGRVIEETISSLGYRVIKNLSGHSIGRYMIHGGLSIPNYNEVFNRWRVGDGVYAIEPFATNGVGYVKSGSTVTIYALKTGRARLTTDERKLYDTIWSSRRTLPFCERWYIGLFQDIGVLKTSLALLDKHGMLHKYPVLVEKSGGYVAQFEHTLVVYGGEVVVSTM